MADADRAAAAEMPLVSVVVPCVNGLPAIAECLGALLGQQGDVPAEVVVVDRCGEGTRAVLRERFPAVRIVAAAPGTGIPALRALGIAQCRAPMVAIIEDHCNVAPGWLSAIDRARRAGHRVVGGAVENASTERLVDWAAFFCEYARFMPPLEGGPVDAVAGNNVAYARELLGEPGGAADGWEFFLHARLAEQGVPFHCDPALVVAHKKEFPFRYFMGQRYHYSRSFAGMRLAGASRARRLLYAAGTPLLPPLLFLRITREVASRRRRVATFLAAAPILAVFLLAWAWGEAVGALAGPGDSLGKVE